MKIGVAYYPEHWDRSFWEKDADLMKKTGVKLVRLAEFAWCRLEPADGKFDFAWLDEAVAVFASRGIEVILCTPTSCPPLWLYENHPDIVHIGVVGKQALYDHMARTTAKNAGLPVVENLPNRVEMVTRTGEKASMRFLFNNDDKQKAFTLEGEEIVLAPFETKIISC